MNGIDKVEYVPIASIRPYENNPRFNDSAVKAVAESIKQFGWQKPIVTDKDGVIIVGHTRYKAAMDLGRETVPVSVAENLTEEQARAYRLADNKTGELSEWDYDKLVEEVRKANSTDFTALGFSEIELLGLGGDFSPEAFEDVSEYDEVSRENLKAHILTITYNAEEEDELKELLGVKDGLKVVYEAEELINLKEKNEKENNSD